MSGPINPKEIPIFDVIAASAALPIRHLRQFLIAAASTVFVFGVFFGGLRLVGLATGPGPLSFGSVAGNFGAFLLLALTFFLPMTLAFVAFFNLWVRMGVMGDNRAWNQPVGQWVRQVLGCGGNLIWIGILVGLASWAFMIPFTAIFGGIMANMASSGYESGNLQLAKETLSLLTLMMFLIAIPATWIACLVYAVFSLNIVESALGENYDSSNLPRDRIEGGAFRFSIILIGVYIAGKLLALLLIPLQNVAALKWVVAAMEIGILFYGIAVIGSAHGIVFRLKTGRTGTRAEDIAVASDSAVATAAAPDLPEE